MTTPDTAYTPRRPAHSERIGLRGRPGAPLLDLHLLRWGSPQTATLPPVLLLHGWMDVGASFQFLVDAFDDTFLAGRELIALDWRGFGETRCAEVDAYWFPDYLADLDALLDVLSPDAPVDLIGHSMGANVTMLYAGVRPQRVRRAVNLEGFGMPPTRAVQAPDRYARWLDELRQPAELRPYADLAGVARRLRANNPRLPIERALWLAAQWSRPTADGLHALRADPAHKHSNPMLARQEEMEACWRRITAPVLWIEAAQTEVFSFWQMPQDAVRAEVERRKTWVADLRAHVLDGCGHMLHHDQPDALAAWIQPFLAR
ncbi:alpha/beta fold hydrolase [Sphaerotilus mobilis]|uniref:Pimeloyl-ACP methyl ester carboxylesterase n=1 Tax=Sphaerotilus mobilis TaxID=47994 RepID=A0A4V2EWR1_9BURK|nr:alpha/beta hydrolase [Sphaerotilus mobilis]RZS56870.1 pimeloyl-ACP methyl ester carboxylesterase [Sphaerotilus mobilis]